MEVQLKIQGQAMTVDTSRMHQSWVDHCLAYGVRRFPNDKYSSDKGQVKIDLVQALLADMQSGEEMPAIVRGSGGGASANPVETLALRNAKATLTMMFKQITGLNKALDFAKHEKIAKFFKITEDRATWKDDIVRQWMAKQAEAGKVDYLGDAKATIEAASELEF